MKIKIKKEGKTKVFKLIQSWKDVNLETFLKLIEFQKGTKSSEAERTIAALSDIPKDLIKKLELKDVAAIMNEVAQLQAEEKTTLKRIVEIGDKKYGFHPNLDSITLGEWADIETFVTTDVEKYLPEVMAILYRPIIEETESGVYTIESYDGNVTIRAEEMKKMSAEQVQSALVFFYHLGNEWSSNFKSSSMETQKETTTQ
tara:strand:- start:827 stop:1429 length:603 start_codon:yes stop_codon:yes gene_type:complete